MRIWMIDKDGNPFVGNEFFKSLNMDTIDM
jgi:hypothetical protein